MARGTASCSHLKAMGSYQQHARGDAVAMAMLLLKNSTAARARAIFERVPTSDLLSFAFDAEEDIADFIGRTESQRPSVLLRFADETSRICFVTLAIIGCLRSQEAMAARDRYMQYLVPGRGYRETTQAMYEFACCFESFPLYQWPTELFASLSNGRNHASEADDARDESALPLPVNSLPRLPVEPPPAPPEEEVTEVVVSTGESSVVKASAGSDKPAWKLQLMQDDPAEVYMEFRPEEPSQRELVSRLVEKAATSFGPHPTVFLFPQSQRALIAALNAAAPRQIADVMPRGLANRASAKLPDALMRAFRRELELVGESMPAADELMSVVALDSMIHSDDLDPTEPVGNQRNILEGWVKQVLAGRNRWVGPTNVPVLSKPYKIQDLAKAKREVKKLEGARLTPEGACYWAILNALLAWREDETSTEAAMQVITHSYLKWVSEDTTRDRRRDTVHREIGQILATGSVEMDLASDALLRNVQRPFQMGIGSPSNSHWPSVHGAVRLAGWFSAWWVVVTAESPEAMEDRRWMPSEDYLRQIVQSSLGGRDIRFKVAEDLEGLELAPSDRPSRPWEDKFSHHGFDYARRLLSWLQGHSKSFTFDGQRISGTCRRWGLLVAVSGPTEEAVVAARAAWTSEVSRQLQQRIFHVDGRKRVRPPASLRVTDETVDLLRPHAAIDERMALLAGWGWDAENKKAFARRSNGLP